MIVTGQVMGLVLGLSSKACSQTINTPRSGANHKNIDFIYPILLSFILIFKWSIENIVMEIFELELFSFLILIFKDIW